MSAFRSLHGNNALRSLAKTLLCQNGQKKVHLQSVIVFHQRVPHHHIFTHLCTKASTGLVTNEPDKPSAAISPEPKAPLASKYPVPPTGKLNLVRNGQLTHVKVTEMYDHLRYLPSESVLETFVANMSQMDKMHFAVGLKRLNAVIHRLHPDAQDEYVQKLYADERFQVLVAMITRKGRFYDADVQYNILRALHELGFHTNHPSIKVFLQLLQHSINKLFLDQLIQLLAIVDLLDDCPETILLRHAIEQLVSLRLDELKFLDGFQAALFLDFFPGLLGKSKKDYLVSKMKTELLQTKVDHHFAHLALRVFAKSMQTEHPIVDRAGLQRVLLICEKCCDKYTVTEICDILCQLKQLRVYRRQMFEKIANMFSSGSMRKCSVMAKIRALHLFCEHSYFPHELCQTIESDLDPTELKVSDLISYVFCSWTFNYEFQKQNTFARCMDALCEKLKKHTLPVAVYLELCLVLSTSDLDIPECLSNLEVVTSSEYSTKLESMEEDSTLEKGDKVKVIMPLKENDNGIFQASYTRGWPVSRREVINIIKQRWPVLPEAVDTIYNNSVESDRMWKPNIPEFELYLIRASSGYDVSKDCTLTCGLSVDFVLSKKPENHKDDECQSSEEVVQNPRLALKLLPPSVNIRNHPGLKRFPSVYLSCIQSEGYRTLVVTSHSWRQIPHAERESYLEWCIKKALSDQSCDQPLVI